jgi:signal transduction histidine kinase/ligand-binding sensor domain-containing protein
LRLPVRATAAHHTAVPHFRFGRQPRRLILFLLLPFLGRLPAAEPHQDWTTRVWKTEEGLAANNVTDLEEATDGFLWLVAGGRVARFDGVTVEDFPLAALSADQAQRMRAVQRLRNGDLVFLTTDGVVVRASGGKTTVFAAELPLGARADTLVEDEDGGLLISYQNGLLYRWHSGRLLQLDESHGLPATRDRCTFATDSAGNLWVAKGGAVGIFRDGRFHSLLRLEGPVVRLAAARAGGVWICSRLQLLHYAEGGTPREAGRVPATNREALPSALLEDRSGAVWIGTTISGLFRWLDGRFENVPISHREVVNLMEDREGNLWVGTSGGGLNQVQARPFRIEGAATGVPFRAVQALCQDPAGNLWAVAQDGTPVKRIDDRWENIFAPGDGFAGEATCIAADATGAIWIGTRNHRLYRWQEGRLTSWGEAEGLLGAGMRTVVTGATGELWIGGSRPGSLQRFRNGRFENFELPVGCDSIWAITRDPAGNIWAGGTGSTLLRISPTGTLTDETARTGPQPNPIRTLHATPDGTVWIGYDHGGLGRLTKGGFKLLTTKDGLVDDNLRLVISDQQGWLWCAAVTAVFKVRLQELDAVAEGRAPRIQPVQYGRYQGLHVVLGGSIGALVDRAGQLWLPLATSLAVIHPAQQQHHVEPPSVVITHVTVDEQVLASYGGVLPPPVGTALGSTPFTLGPDHRRLTFAFTALSFSAPHNVRFRYQLENFDDRWIEAGTQRTSSYSRLRGGDYRFRVKASNSDGVWNETGTVVAFTVAPFFWETWWFRAAMIAGFTAAVFSLARFVAGRRVQAKLRALEQQAAVERERTRIARDIHDDLGSRLTKIALLGGLANRERAEPEKVNRRMQEIADTARQLLKSLDETVWAVTPRNDNLPNLVDYLGQFVTKFLATAEIACVLDLPDDPPARPVSAEARHNLFLTVKEALTNVVKHAHAHEVRFTCRVEPAALEVVIADDGLGCADHAPDDAEADGLRNMRQRMTLLGGRFDFVSAPGGGTRITLSLPLSAAAT